MGARAGVTEAFPYRSTVPPGPEQDTRTCPVRLALGAFSC